MGVTLTVTPGGRFRTGSLSAGLPLVAPYKGEGVFYLRFFLLRARASRKSDVVTDTIHVGEIGISRMIIFSAQLELMNWISFPVYDRECISALRGGLFCAGSWAFVVPCRCVLSRGSSLSSRLLRQKIRCCPGHDPPRFA